MLGTFNAIISICVSVSNCYDCVFHSLGKRVKEVVHQAFWDLLAENLKQTPPIFDQALSLLTDIKIVST